MQHCVLFLQATFFLGSGTFLENCIKAKPFAQKKSKKNLKCVGVRRDPVTRDKDFPVVIVRWNTG